MLLCVFILLSLVTPPAITAASRKGVFPCSSNQTERLEEFECHNGAGCIDIKRICNGVRDCEDDSDEGPCLHPDDQTLPLSESLELHRSKRQSSCGENEKQCHDGTCVSLDGNCGASECQDSNNETDSLCKHKSSRTGGCILPPQPDNGMYEVANVQNTYPGQAFDSFVLTVSCRRGYGIMGSTGGNDGTESLQVYCINGRWPKRMPKCVRFCKLDPDPSVRYMCHVPATNGFKTCPKYVAPGTSVSPICNTPIYYSTESLLYMRCISGTWDNVAKCKAECGRVTPEGEQLIIDGTNAKRGELPWHVGIYRKYTNPYMQICGGSLISNNVVITAAHCFWSDVKKRLPAADFAVAIGKLYRPWNNDKEPSAQKSEIREIMMPRLFQGEDANFQGDIAVVVLATPFIYKTFIRPVCLNFDLNFERWQLQHGKLGKVAGWGLTQANGNASSILKVVELPYINEDICINTIPVSFREYVTIDKFCAGYTNGTTVCKGDSGGGLAFADKELGIDRYYLRGIVSAAPKSEQEEKLCNDDTYTVFTRILKHEEFIKRSVAASVKRACRSFQFSCADGTCVDQEAECNGIQDCPDGSDEYDDLCTSGTDGQTDTPASQNFTPACILPPYPEDGTYEVANTPNAEPGQSFDTVMLSVFCRPGYGMVDSEGGIDLSNIRQIYCVNGAWDKGMPKCVRFCKLEPEPSVRHTCQVPGTNGFKPCPEYVPPGVNVIPICNSPNFYSTEILQFMNCKNGSWSHVAKCKAECGRVTPQGEPLLVGGRPAKRGEVPWHVGVYSKKNKPYMQICGGTLVSNDIVISGAHCFWDDVKHQLPASDYAVASGKLYRPFNNSQDVDAQKSDVKEISLPKFFWGNANNFQADIAILKLETPFVYKPYVRPVCINFEKTQLQNKLGKVAGWGLNKVNGRSSPILRVVELPHVGDETCINTMPDSFKPYVTSDKFCAGYNEGTVGMCKGDSGGGLAFPHTEQGVERYYLRGLVSTAPRNDDLCNADVYTMFTSISKYEDFVSQYI